MYCTRKADYTNPWTLKDPVSMQFTCDRIMEEIFGE